MNLKDLVQTDLDSRWFHFDDDLNVVGEADSVFALKLKYVSPDDVQKFVERATERKAVSKKGLKAFVASQSGISKQMARAALIDWRLTMRGCRALKAQLNFQGVNLDDPVEFNGDNIATLIDHSELATLINGTATDYEAWFGSDRGDESPTTTPDGQSD